MILQYPYTYNGKMTTYPIVATPTDLVPAHRKDEDEFYGLAEDAEQSEQISP